MSGGGWRRLFRSRAFLLLVVLLVILAVVGASLTADMGDDGSDLQAVASTSTPLVRTGDSVLLSSEGSRGDIAAYAWEFGDGQAGNGSEVSHMYEVAGLYNVTLTVLDGGGRNDTASVQVAVQQNDTLTTRDLERQRDVRPMWMHGYGLLGAVGPNVGNPTAELSYSLERAFGTFIIYVEVWIEEGDVNRVEELYREEHTVTDGTVDFTYTVGPEDWPEEVPTNASRVHVSALINQGRYASGHIEVVVTFPFEEPALAEG